MKPSSKGSDLCRFRLNQKKSFHSNFDYRLKMKMQCEYLCKGEKNFNELEKVESFSPKDLGMNPGDGSSDYKIIWASLAMELQYYFESICYESSLKACREKNQILSNFKVKKVSTQKWSYDPSQMTCQSPQQILSPYDESIWDPLKMKQNPSLSPFGASTSELVGQSRIFHGDTPKAALFNVNGCKKIVNISTCFGDCVFDAPSGSDQQWSETLQTTEPLARESYEVCLDEFETSSVLKASDSIQIKNYKCRDYLWEKLKEFQVTGTSCAAFRFETHCYSSS